MMVMQWVPGPPLFEYVCQSGLYNEAVAQRFMRQLFNVLAYLHEQNLAHADIKPENMLIDPTKPDPLLYLIDFGDAVSLDEEADEIRSPYFQGNVECAAPEQLDSRPLTCAVDLWSAGVCLYVFLSGLSPFFDETVEETRRNTLTANFTLPLEPFSRVSSSSRRLLQCLLVLEAGDRPTASDCLKHQWLEEDLTDCQELPVDRLAAYVERRRYQATTRSYLLPL